MFLKCWEVSEEEGEGTGLVEKRIFFLRIFGLGVEEEGSLFTMHWLEEGGGSEEGEGRG